MLQNELMCHIKCINLRKLHLLPAVAHSMLGIIGRLFVQAGLRQR
jgi:hypothetical protein